VGVLSVHLDEHAFDTELYADELGLGLPPDRMLPAVIGPDDVRSALFFFSIFGPRLMAAIDVE
jgi:hypothetical protein